MIAAVHIRCRLSGRAQTTMGNSNEKPSDAIDDEKTMEEEAEGEEEPYEDEDDEPFGTIPDVTDIITGTEDQEED